MLREWEIHRRRGVLRGTVRPLGCLTSVTDQSKIAEQSVKPRGTARQVGARSFQRIAYHRESALHPYPGVTGQVRSVKQPPRHKQSPGHALDSIGDLKWGGEIAARPHFLPVEIYRQQNSGVIFDHGLQPGHSAVRQADGQYATFNQVIKVKVAELGGYHDPETAPGECLDRGMRRGPAIRADDEDYRRGGRRACGAQRTGPAGAGRETAGTRRERAIPRPECHLPTVPPGPAGPRGRTASGDQAGGRLVVTPVSSSGVRSRRWGR